MMMKDLWKKIRGFFKNRWVKFYLVTLIYVLWFVVWSRNLWMLLGVIVIYDIYISKYMYRWFWKRHKEKKKENKTYKEVWSWIEAIVFAVVVASVIHIYVFQMYKIPTSSMEKTLLVGDHLYVSKLAYGPRMPNTPISFPLVHNTMPFSPKGKRSYSEVIQRPYKRLAGLGHVKRNDIVVFNFPAGDTVVLEQPAMPYYDILRDFQRTYGEVDGRRRLWDNFNVVSRPVDKREHYVKRCVAVPGDTLQILHSQLFINGEPQQKYPGMQYRYIVRTSGTPVSKQTLQEMGVSNDDIPANRTEFMLPLTTENAERMRGLKNVTSVTKYEERHGELYIFPNNEQYSWNEDNFGPLWIPQKGITVTLNRANLPLYERIIKVYEGNRLRVEDDAIYINDQPADSYTFQMDYYFMMGDNRHYSLDSRFWGFVPEDHVVGKPSFVWLSTNKDKSFPYNIRWKRFFESPK